MKTLIALLLAVLVTSSFGAEKTKAKLQDRKDDDPYRLFSIDPASTKMLTTKTTIELVVHDDAEVNNVCQTLAKKGGMKNGFGHRAYGCAVFTKSLIGGHKCTIYLGRKTDQNQLGHEVRHCFVGQFHN
jgi:hypothetical protein